MVLCVDEKSQIQALNRTQPTLPMGLGYAEGYTHDYVHIEADLGARLANRTTTFTSPAKVLSVSAPASFTERIARVALAASHPCGVARGPAEPARSAT